MPIAVDSDGTELGMGDRMICLCCGARGVHKPDMDWNFEGSSWVKDVSDPASSFDANVRRMALGRKQRRAMEGTD